MLDDAVAREFFQGDMGGDAVMEAVARTVGSASHVRSRPATLRRRRIADADDLESGSGAWLLVITFLSMGAVIALAIAL